MEAKNRRGELKVLSPANGINRRLPGLRVLVVDDSEINREVAQRILEGEGAEVALATDGLDALNQLKSRAGHFDVVLMDVQMPVMDGYAASRQIRATPALAHLPVVALTAGAFKHQKDAAYESGVNDFVAKPFDVDELVKVLRRLTPDKFSAAPDREASREPAAPDKTGRRHTDPLPVLDIERGLEIWRDTEAYKKYLRKFAHAYGDSLRSSDSSTPDLPTLAHKMRGVAGSLALSQLAALSGDLERRLESGMEAGQALERLRSGLSEAVVSITEYTASPHPPVADQPICLAPERVAPLLALTLTVLNEDNPDTVEPLLEQLDALLPRTSIGPLRAAVENFDFRGNSSLAISGERRLRSFQSVRPRMEMPWLTVGLPATTK
jgi:CheY-like chemotaxis protein/HPt (histidine-containing phosphotransfer) domain-containing protein